MPLPRKEGCENYDAGIITLICVIMLAVTVYLFTKVKTELVSFLIVLSLDIGLFGYYIYNRYVTCGRRIRCPPCICSKYPSKVV